MFILANMWFQTLMRQFFFNIDKIVFGFISTIYDFLITIARTSILSQADIIDMADRIYKLLAIFMVFKVTFSLIMYVVNPDDFSDKTKGVGKLTTNIIISLALLILTPYIFNYAYQLQTIILEDNSLATLVFGKDTVGDKERFLDTAGDRMAYITMTPFFSPNLAVGELYVCTQLTEKVDNTVRMNNECSQKLENLTINNDRFSHQTYLNYKAGIDNGNLGILFRQDAAIATTKENNDYIIDYKYILSTVVGVIVILLLITFCMDVALRSIKLAFLQLIAPIPIISYIDPKSGKDGMFKKWYQMCFKTYVSLFIRLLALYFAVYIIYRVDKMSDIVTGAYVTNALIKIAIIIGSLMFAKQLPKILEGLGIKLDGDGKFFLNPIKKFSEQALGGKQIVGATKGAFIGGAMGIAGAATGSGVGRAFTGFATGIKSGIQGKKAGEIRKDQATRNAEMRRAIASGSSWGERMGARYSSFLGTPGRLGRLEHDKMMLQNEMNKLDKDKQEIQKEIAPKTKKIEQHKRLQESISAMEKRAKSEIEQGNSDIGKEYLQRKAKVENLKNNGKIRPATNEELAAAQAELDSVRAGRTVKRAATTEEMNQARKDLQDAMAGKGSTILGRDGRPVADQAKIAEAQKKLDDLANNGVEQHQAASAEEIAQAQAKLDDLKNNGVKRTAKDEEIAQAEYEMNNWLNDVGMKQYMTDVISGKIDDKTFMNTYENSYKENVKEIYGEDEAKNLTYADGSQLHSQFGQSKGTVGGLEKEIYQQRREIEAIDIQQSEHKSEMQQIDHEITDARSSIQAVHGQEGGPSRPGEIARTRQAGENQTVGRSGSGSFITVDESGFGGSNNTSSSSQQGGRPPIPPRGRR